jgi:hypothetical protein
MLYVPFSTVCNHKTRNLKILPRQLQIQTHIVWMNENIKEAYFVDKDPKKT